MVSFARSTPALPALVALHLSRTGMRLSDVARLIGTGVSTMQRSLGLLLRDEVIERVGSRYVVRDGPRSRSSVSFAMAFLPPAALARALSANPSVELAGVDATGILIVVERFPEPLDEARLRAAIDSLRSARPEVDVRLLAHHQLRQELLGDASLHQRIRAMTVVKSDQGTPGASAVDQPRPVALRRFAASHGLRRVVMFGSAARGDASPSSDVDLLVETASGAKPSAPELASIVADAERLFGRDVDVLVGQPRDPALRDSIRVEGMVLHDAG